MKRLGDTDVPASDATPAPVDPSDCAARWGPYRVGDQVTATVNLFADAKDSAEALARATLVSGDNGDGGFVFESGRYELAVTADAQVAEVWVEPEAPGVSVHVRWDSA